MLISVLKIVGNTAADGPGLRTSVYLAGCSHRCPGCHNPQSWEITNGTEVEVDDVIKDINSYGNRRVTVTGGDPFYQKWALWELVKTLKEQGYEVWVYTGYTLGELRNRNETVISSILNAVDGLVDGPYLQELRDTGLRFRGSSNQSIYLRDSQGNLRVDLEKYSS